MKALSISNLTKTYVNGVKALKGISLDVKEGDFFALLGPNGAGKSTTIGIICTLVNKTQGKVFIYDNDLDTNTSLAKTLIGLVPQEFNCNIFETPLQIVCNQAGYYGIPRRLARKRAEFYLNKLALWEKRNTQVRMLSGGMKRRLLIARALIHEPKLLILDEPTAGVDIEIRRSMWAFLREINNNGTTIILTTHYLEEAENLCEHIAIIDHGNIVENTQMKKLLTTLHMETFVLNLSDPLTAPLTLESYPCRMIDETTLEVDISKQQSMNQLFAELSNQGISVLSMRNKANRLEELFLRLVAGKEDQHAY